MNVIMNNSPEQKACNILIGDREIKNIKMKDIRETFVESKE